MKLTFLLLTVALLSAKANSSAQTVTFSGKSVPLKEVTIAVEKQTGYVFLFPLSALEMARPVSIAAKDMPLDEFLAGVFASQPNLEYTIKGKSIFISEKMPDRPVVAPLPGLPVKAPPLKITVVDSLGNPLAGATVNNKKKKQSKVTAADGAVNMEVDDGDVIEVSFVGYETRTVKVSSSAAPLTVSLKRAEQKLEEVEIVNAGILTRKKESFTGAVASFTGKQLKQIGNGNVLESLKSLDPSFIITPNQNLGSNPNQLPAIQLRGTTSISTSTSLRSQFDADPNLPLFILNGMESSLQQIINLDINRVASITILKDAASTALYGSKAANGVVVVETIRPRPGDLRVSYFLDFRSEIPDLRDYNMMNAEEFLRFQKQSGYYDPAERQNSQLRLDTLYNNRLKAVLGGANTYWLNVPLRNAYTAGHNLRVSGGSNDFQYEVGVSYRGAPGVMKGSGKNTWGGSVDLAYRKNKVNFINQIYIEGSSGKESPYGTFSDYVKMAPFYYKYDEYGRLVTSKYLESFRGGVSSSFLEDYSVPNPIYNALLNGKNQTAGFNVQNNLSFIWDMHPNWRFTSGLLLRKSTGNTTIFTPAANTMFDASPIDQKGSYRYTQLGSWGYQGNAMITYQQVFNDKHSLNGNIRGEINETTNESIGLVATGFPEGVEPNPAFASGYALNSKPSYGYLKSRQVNALASINYVYANKYYIDATYRIDGSTVFGSAKKYSPFWAVGVGWTVNKEDFLQHATWLHLLRLRANIGTNGNQQLGSFVSSSVYRYENNVNGYGTGLYLNALGVPNLAWQNTQQISTGVDLGIANNRFVATLNAFRKLTDPLIVGASAAASVGVPTYALNAGRLEVKGLEGILRYSPIYKLNKGVQWTIGLTGSYTKSEYSGFSSILEKENELAREKFNDESALKEIPNYQRRFLDGNSPDDIWAVRSLGIDPATGNEILLKKDGTHTFDYDPGDEVVVGSAMPKVQGVISSTLNIKGFYMGINLRYSLGGSRLNTAVFSKVENIDFQQLIYNQDRRALYERWTKPGDKAMYKNINLADPNITSMYTPPSSRFVQEENFLTGESISAGYEFQAASHPWLGKVGLKSVRINGYMNEVFRISNIRAERGIDYPFSNIFSFSMNLFF